MSKTSKLTLYIVGIVATVAILIVYANFDPAHNPFPRCIFLSLSGFKCPGCGSQRALHAILHGEFVQAWHYNAALIISIPMLLALAISGLFKKRYPDAYNKLNGGVVIWTVFILVIAWWIARNIFNW